MASRPYVEAQARQALFGLVDGVQKSGSRAIAGKPAVIPCRACRARKGLSTATMGSGKFAPWSEVRESVIQRTS